MLMPAMIEKQPEIAAMVDAVVGELSPRVRHIRYDIARDWGGEWAVFFRVMLADEVSRGSDLLDIGNQVIWRMSERVYLSELGLVPHFDFRSESEQAALNEPQWAAAS
jgi:hypothetical protein